MLLDICHENTEDVFNLMLFHFPYNFELCVTVHDSW